MINQTVFPNHLEEGSPVALALWVKILLLDIREELLISRTEISPYDTPHTSSVLLFCAVSEAYTMCKIVLIAMTFIERKHSSLNIFILGIILLSNLNSR